MVLATYKPLDQLNVKFIVEKPFKVVTYAEIIIIIPKLFIVIILVVVVVEVVHVDSSYDFSYKQLIGICLGKVDGSLILVHIVSNITSPLFCIRNFIIITRKIQANNSW